MNIDFDWLENSVFHRTLSSNEKIFLGDTIQIARFGAGETVSVEKEAGGTIYLLRSGCADLSMRYCGEEVCLNRIGEGTQFGDMSIIDEHDATVTFRATEDCLAYKLNRDVLSRICVNWDKISHNLLLNVIRGMSGIIGQMNQSDAGGQR